MAFGRGDPFRKLLCSKADAKRLYKVSRYSMAQAGQRRLKIPLFDNNMETKPPTPQIRAEFVLDERGNPVVVESRGLKHYKIQLRTEPLSTQLVDTVVYDLHSSFYDPKREVTAEPGLSEYEFPEQITSYGDFVVTAAVSGSAGQ